MQKSIDEMKEIHNKRIKLTKENSRLRRNIKYGPAINAGKQIGKSFGRTAFKVGKIAFSNLQKYAKHVQEQEMKQLCANKKLRKIKSNSSRRKRRR